MKNTPIILLISFLIGSCLVGCQEKATGPVFKASKVRTDLHGGYVDILEPKIAKILDEVHAGGWAYDSEKKIPSRSVVIVTEGKPLPVLPNMGLERKDVAEAFKTDALVKSGWDATINAYLLGKGKHRLEFYAMLEDGTFVPLTIEGKTYSDIEIVD